MPTWLFCHYAATCLLYIRLWLKDATRHRPDLAGSGPIVFAEVVLILATFFLNLVVLAGMAYSLG